MRLRCSFIVLALTALTAAADDSILSRKTDRNLESCNEQKKARLVAGLKKKGRQNGFCVTSNGGDQNDGVVQLAGGDFNKNNNNKVQQCLQMCACHGSTIGQTITGCEMIWGQWNRGCYAHTKPIAKGNNRNNHSCYVLDVLDESKDEGGCNGGDEEEKARLVDELKASKREKGYCVTSNNADQNDGVVKLADVDFRDTSDSPDGERVEQCLQMCACHGSMSGQTITGCEMIWNQYNKGCYAHTKPIAKGNNRNNHSCYVLDKSKDDIQGFNKHLGKCDGATCTIWGDPHVVTCDGLTYDCQGEGLFHLMKNNLYDIQANFVPVWNRAGVTITNDVAIEYVPTAGEHVPRMQFSFAPNLLSYDDHYYEYGPGECPVGFYLDGELQDIREILQGNNKYVYGNANSDHSVRFEGRSWIHIVHKLASGATSEIHLKVAGKGPGELWSCHWNLNVCLPKLDHHLTENSVGLLGTPDGYTRNDWMDRSGNTVTIPTRNRNKEAFDYCHEWCVAEEGDSIMTLPDGTSFEDRKCGGDEDQYVEVTIDDETCDISLEEIDEKCAGKDLAMQHGCRTDACFGGGDDIDEVVNDVVEINTLSDKEEDTVYEFEEPVPPTDAPVVPPTDAPVVPPTEAPVDPPTDAPVVPPTEAPVVSSPTCTQKEELSVCFAIDNSGSICNNKAKGWCKLCDDDDDRCGSVFGTGVCDQKGADDDYQCGNYKNVIDFVGQIAFGLPDSGSKYAALKFSTGTQPISSATSSVESFIDLLVNSDYNGGWTNTQQAIEKCADLIKEESNPIIVLITDGTPTACNPEGASNHQASTKKWDCDGNKQTALAAAFEAADAAWADGVDIIPVIIESKFENVTALESLARCKNNDGPCSKYFGIKVGDTTEVNTIVDDVIEAAACEDPTNAPVVPPPTDAPVVPPTDAPFEDTITDAPVIPPLICPDDITLLKTVGETDFPSTPAVKIVSQDTSTVTVELNQEWSGESKLDSIFYEYRKTQWSTQCYEVQDTIGGTLVSTITITCNYMTPLAYLHICLVDDIKKGVLSGQDNATIPKCCRDGEVSPDPTVCYSLEISCVSLCIDQQEKQEERLLRGSKN